MDYCMDYLHSTSILRISLVQVRCMIQDARGWCTGRTQRDGMGREEGGGFRMGNTCVYTRGEFMLMYGKTNTIL